MPKRKHLLWVLEIALLVGVCVVVGLRLNQNRLAPGEIEVTIQLRDARDKGVLFQNEAGQLRYRIKQNDGTRLILSPDELADRMYPTPMQQQQWSRLTIWFRKILNVSSPMGYVWVGLGAVGQFLFTGRMIVQWLASEKNKKVTVPPAFWWMSLAGSTMLMIYFLWREDPIGLLGQSIGWFVYIRNLILIYSPQQPPADTTIATERLNAKGPKAAETDTTQA